MVRRLRRDVSRDLRLASRLDVLAVALALVDRQRWVVDELADHDRAAEPAGPRPRSGGWAWPRPDGSWWTCSASADVAGRAWGSCSIGDDLVRGSATPLRGPLVAASGAGSGAVTLNLLAVGGTGDTVRTLNILRLAGR